MVNPFEIVTARESAARARVSCRRNRPGLELHDCAKAANAAFNTTFFTGGNTTAFPPSVTYTPPVIVPAQYQKWSLEIQKGFGANDSLYVGYFGNHGIHEPIVNNSVNAFRTFDSELPLRMLRRLNLRRLRRFPAPAFRTTTGSLLLISTASRSGVAAYFNSITFTAMRSTLSQTAVSTRSRKSQWRRRNGAVSLNPQNPYDFKQNYGPADYDVRHSLNANYVWQVPIRKMLGGHGWAPLVEGWQVSGAVYYRTGFPFSVIDPSFTGVNNYHS